MVVVVSSREDREGREGREEKTSGGLGYILFI